VADSADLKFAGQIIEYLGFPYRVILDIGEQGFLVVDAKEGFIKGLPPARCLNIPRGAVDPADDKGSPGSGKL